MTATQQRVAAVIEAIALDRQQRDEDYAAGGFTGSRDGYRPPIALAGELTIATAERAIGGRYFEIVAEDGDPSSARDWHIALIGRLVDEERRQTLRAAGIF